MGFHLDFDHRLQHPRLAVHEAGKILRLIQDGLNVKLNSRFPPCDCFCLDNKRLSKQTGSAIVLLRRRSGGRPCGSATCQCTPGCDSSVPMSVPGEWHPCPSRHCNAHRGDRFPHPLKNSCNLTPRSRLHACFYGSPYSQILPKCHKSAPLRFSPFSAQPTPSSVAADQCRNQLL
jgi:hypothetical protein